MWITFHVPATWVPLGVDAISDLGSGKDGCDCVFPPLRLTALRHLNRLAVQQGDTLTLQSILHVTCARISLVSIQAQCHPCACYGNGTTLTLSIWQWFLQGFLFFSLKSNYAPPPPNKTSPFGQIARWTASISIQNLHHQPFCIPLRASSAEMYSLESSCSGRRVFSRWC